MNNNGQTGRTITRRAWSQAPRPARVALASRSGIGATLPGQPPARTKGPLVWLDIDQHELDEAYDQSVYAFNQRPCRSGATSATR